jgi:hypothetical protein
MAPSPSLCGGSVSSKRGLLASLWSIVIALTAIAFAVALIFTLSAQSARDDSSQYYYNNDEEAQRNNQDNLQAEMAVTSRAMAFAALWTVVLSTLMAIFGAVILGWQSPTGVYYTCCAPAVHRTTPLALGSFIGALLMFANLTLVCSILFGEFDVSGPGVCVCVCHLERKKGGKPHFASVGRALINLRFRSGLTSRFLALPSLLFSF